MSRDKKLVVGLGEDMRTEGEIAACLQHNLSYFWLEPLSTPINKTHQSN
jgi:hypothetical protein